MRKENFEKSQHYSGVKPLLLCTLKIKPVPTRSSCTRPNVLRQLRTICMKVFFLSQIENTQNPQYCCVNELESETRYLYNLSFSVTGSSLCKIGVCSHVLNLLYVCVCVYTNEEQYTVCVLIRSSLFIWVSSVLISC